MESSFKPPSGFNINLHAKCSKHETIRSSNIVAKLPYARDPIPIIIQFKALGFVSVRDIIDHTIFDPNDADLLEIMKPSFAEASDVKGEHIALNYIRTRATVPGTVQLKRNNFASSILDKHFLPHIGVTSDTRNPKAYFLGYMVHKLLSTELQRRAPDDRNYLGTKRVDLAGPLLSSVFHQFFRNMVKYLKNHTLQKIDRKTPLNPSTLIRSGVITDGRKYSLSTGNWGDQSGKQPRKGVSQVINRLTYMSTLSHLRRINHPIGKDGKLTKPRQLRNTQWRMICPDETPEVHAIRLVKNLSLIAHISTGSKAGPIFDFLHYNDDSIGVHMMPNDAKLRILTYIRLYKVQEIIQQGRLIWHISSPQLTKCND